MSGGPARPRPLDNSPMDRPVVLILAAGQGTRMKSARAKVLHPLLGRPLVAWVLEAAAALAPEKVVVVTGHQAGEVEAACREAGVKAALEFVEQRERKGTGDAVKAALPSFEHHDGPVVILAGDVPHLTGDTLLAGLKRYREQLVRAAIFTAEPPVPYGYGRILRDPGGNWVRIVEEKDASEAEKRIREVNAGVYVVNARALAKALPELTPHNAQGEYYLTDAFAAIRSAGGKVALHPVADAGEVEGINDRVQLARAEARERARKNRALMLSGVTLTDPTAVYADWAVSVGPDTLVHPGVELRGRTTIGAGCEIGQGCVLTDAMVGDGTVIKPHCVLEAVIVGRDARVGPSAHLRPGTRLADGVHLGNFVETKQASLGAGSKANHLSYLGDAEIGAGVNIGAGTITCNYDGVNKHRTVIEDGVFVGSDTAIVAPRTLGARSVIGAGTTVRHDVPPDTLYLTLGEKKEVKGHPVVKAIAAKAAGKKPPG